MKDRTVWRKIIDLFFVGKSIRWKFLIWMIPSLAVVLLLLFGTLFYREKEKRLASNEVNLSKLTHSYAEQVNMLVKTFILEIRQLSNIGSVKTMDWNIAGEDLIRVRNNRSDIYAFFGFCQPDGSHHTTLKGKGNSNLKELEHFKKIFLENKEVVISNPYKSITTGNDIFVLNVPVRNDENKTIGMVSGICNLKSISAIVSEIKIGNAGYGFLIDNTGLIFAHPSDDIRMKVNVNEAEGYEEFGKLLKKDAGVCGITNAEGEQEFLFFKKIVDSPGWTLAVTIPRTEVFAPINDLFYLLVFFSLITLICIVGLIALLSQSLISRPLKNLITYVEKISVGQLYHTIETKGKDEVGLMARSLGNMSSKLQDIVANIRDSSNSVAQSAKQLFSAASQIAQGANEQAASSEEISSSMEEMVSSIDQNAANSQVTEKIALSVARDVEKVAVASKKSLDSVKMIVEKIGTINNIAEKTDLLAINAAVEAARAGEYGKGFAVVATEVRKLAEYSQKAANVIMNLANESLKTTQEAGDLIVNIVPEINKNAELVREISSTSIEQNSGATQINEAIQQYSQITQQNAAASEELATSSEEMTTQAVNLKQMMSFFKIEETENESVDGIFMMIDKYNIEIEKLRKQLQSKENSEKNSDSQNTDKVKKQSTGVKIKLTNNDTDDNFEQY